MTEKLPVLILSKHVLLPYQDLKLDLTMDTSKEVVDKACEEYNKKILVIFSDEAVTDKNVSNLSEVGVIEFNLGIHIKNKMNVEKSFVFFEKDSEFFEKMLLCLQLCNNVGIGQNGYVGSATEIARANFADKFGFKKEIVQNKYKRIAEEPFSSQRKMMTTLNVFKDEKLCFCKGAIDKILQKCNFFTSESGILPLDDKTKKIILNENERMCKESLRVVCFAKLGKIGCNVKLLYK